MLSTDVPTPPGPEREELALHPLDLTGAVIEPLRCPSCQQSLRADDLDAGKGIAQCPHCYHAFGYSHDPATGQLRPERLQPEGVEMLKLRHELDVRLRWLHTTSAWGRKFFLLFASLWNLILLPFVLTMILSGEWGILLFISLHLLVGLGLIWYLAAIYVNETSLSVKRDRIRLESGPLRMPFRRPVVIDPADVDQFYVSKYTEGTQNGTPRYAYALYALLKNGEKISLLRGMNEATQAYLERELEDFLGIKDKPVKE